MDDGPMRDFDGSGEVTQGKDPHLVRVFGTVSLLMFGLAYLVPLTVFTTFGPVTQITQGHLPLAYIATTAAMLFTAYSYASLVRVIPMAGSAYSYSRKAFGERAGFITGWTLLLDYILLPAINYLIIGIYLNAQFPEIPMTVFILSAIAIVTFLNVVGVDVIKRASFILVIAQLVFTVVFVAAAFTRDETVLTFEPFYEAGLEWGLIFSGAAILCLSFLGFDAVSTLSEEARNPTRTVPRAIMLTTIVGGCIFIVLSYAGAVLLPDWQGIQSSDSAGLEVMAPLGTTISLLFITAYLAGCVASALASQASVSRILFAMGREGVLPRRWFGRLSRRFNTPTNASLTVAAVSLVTLMLSLETMASLISFGALFAFSVVNLSVIRVFAPEGGTYTAGFAIRYRLCPLVGLALTGWLWFHLSWVALGVGLIWLSVGLAYSLRKSARLPLPASV
jgi:amino acid transporter